MKTTNSWKGMVAAGLVAVVSCGVMAEDVVQERFRKALFAEESDQDLAEAVKGYEAVLEGAETPLRTAATALYRLGECHRKLGRTNEAAAAFGRLAREFPGQTNLVRLARQNLVALGKGEPASVAAASSDLGGGAGAGAGAEANPALAKARADLAEAARIEAVVLMIEGFQEAEKDWRTALRTAFPSPAFERAEESIREAQKRLRRLSTEMGPQHPEVKAADREFHDSQDLLERELFRARSSKKLEVEVLRRGAEAQIKALGVAASMAVPAAPVDPEDAEIERLKRLEKDTPDLLRTGPANDVAPIEQAVGRGQTRVVEHLLGRGVALEASRRLNQSTLLEMAVINGRVAMVDLLLARGLDVNQRGSVNSTPLHWAVVRQYEAVVEHLLKGKPDLELLSGPLMGNPPSTPLGLAVHGGNLSIARRLMAGEAKLRQPAGSEPLLFRALKSKSVAMLQLLLEANADPREVFSGRTVLHEAVLAEQPEKTVPLLLAKDADVNALNQGGESPLLLALQRNLPTSQSRAALVALLLKSGANPNLGTDQATPLIAAVSAGSAELVRQLLDAGADPNFRPKDGGLPLIVALDSHDEIFGLLLDHGAKPDTVVSFTEPRSGLRAINWVLDVGSRPKLELLLKHGADPNARNGQGLTPLEWLQRATGLPQVAVAPGPRASGSARASAEELAEVLRKAGARDDVPDPNSIRIRRDSTRSVLAVIRRDAADLNRLTALEAVATFYGWLDPVATVQDVRRMATRKGLVPTRPNVGISGPGFEWPAWDQVTIQRPKEVGTGWDLVPLNLSNLVTGANCGDSPVLHWGDVIQIPETVHALGVSDPYKGKALWPAVTNCLFSARFTMVVAGRTSVLGAGFEKLGNGMNVVSRPSGLCDWLVKSGLPTNADVSRVRVRRRAFLDQPAWDRIFDLSKDQPEQADLFLRDGDVIEVPEVGAVQSDAPGKARFFGELNGTVPIPPGEEIWLSEAIIGLGHSGKANLKMVRVHSRPGTDGRAESVTVNVEKILKENLRSEDVRLRDGDRIEVPARVL